MLRKILFYIFYIMIILASLFFNGDALKEVSSAIVTFAGLVIAGVLPAATLTATALQGDFGSLSRLRKIYTALSAQVTKFALLFFSCISLCVFLIFAHIFDWPSHTVNLKFLELNFSTNIIVFPIFYTVIINTGSIFYGILRINSVIYSEKLRYIKNLYKEESKKNLEDISQIENSPGYARYVPLPEPPASPPCE